MRDPERIPHILECLRQVWARNPDLRLGQLLVNITGEVDNFNIEDDDLLWKIYDWHACENAKELERVYSPTIGMSNSTLGNKDVT